MVLRIDFVFSYWIFTWFLLYMIGVVPFNPKLFLILGIFSIFVLPPPNKSIYFLIINTFIKVLPLYLIWNTKIKNVDNYFGVGLGFLYLIWLKLNKEDVMKMRTPIADYLRDKNIYS